MACDSDHRVPVRCGAMMSGYQHVMDDAAVCGLEASTVNTKQSTVDCWPNELRIDSTVMSVYLQNLWFGIA